MEILEKARSMLGKYPICDHCLGRQFALLGYGLDDKKRGDVMKTLLTMEANKLALVGEKDGSLLLETLATNGSFDMAAKVLAKMGRMVGKKRRCHLCEGRFDQLPALVSRSVEKLEDYDYATFLVGINLPNRVEEKEDEFKSEFEVEHSEGMRNGFSREIGKEISRITEKMVEYKTPDMVVIVIPFSDEVALQANPLYVAGRYRKLVRGIPQSRWFCPKCRSKGCVECNWTGKMYPESVEELISAPLLEETGGEETTLHAAGREDVDARMLGRGRPFVIEIKKPRKRLVDLKALTKAINKQAEKKVKVLSLHFADKDTVRRLKKGEGASKIYRVIVEFNRVVPDEKLRILEQTLTNAIIRQQTPLRVLHRRANRIREKYIYEAKIERLKPNRMEMRIHCQGGLYIKELITGDKGRTDPNVAALIGAKAQPMNLDVLNIIPREG
ncbi:MAG: tRNA pseudouridine(54/55) synthase Pus10 [Candidatus Bathyarchaeota archaeon]|nr:MAG: tRNA pseudouridine(54/55) synthase Pus10 [Candidatus Bathyarchaeota archaeon]